MFSRKEELSVIPATQLKDCVGREGREGGRKEGKERERKKKKGRKEGREGGRKQRFETLPKTSNDFSPTLEHHKDIHLLRDLLSPNDPACLQNVALPCE